MSNYVLHVLSVKEQQENIEIEVINNDILIKLKEDPEGYLKPRVT